MNRRLYFIAAFIFKIAAPQIFSHTSLFGTSMSVTLQCETTDLNRPIFFKLNTFSQGGCSAGGSCSTGVDGYKPPTQGTNTTEMVIKSCNITRDLGNWTCVYGGSTSIAVTISHCPGGTNTSTDKDGEAIGILAGCLVIAYIIVIVMVALRLFIRYTKNSCGIYFLRFCHFIEEKLVDCCGRINSKKNWLLGFVYLVLYGLIVDVIVLLAVYYGYSKFQEKLVIGVGVLIVLVLSGLCLLVVVWMLKKFVNNETSRPQSCISNGTVTPHERGKSQKKSTFDKRQQPDGDEGPQSTPKDTDARHLTTGRPLPRKPDIASPQTGSFDSVNSPRPIENPKIPPSIDTLDEQKTDKKPKDKKKKKKMKDEEQDNPADVQDNNVLT